MVRRALAIVVVSRALSIKHIIVLMIGLAAIANSTAVAADSVWKAESAEAAEEQLHKMRAAAGTLGRFEAEFLRSEIDFAGQKDERWRLRVYVEPAGFLIESLPCDVARMTARRGKSGRPCELSAAPPETWLCVDGTCTRFNETERTYGTVDVRPGHFFQALREAPRQMLPPWLDPKIDWKDLKSRYRVQQARSTATEFLVELVLEEKGKGAELSSDNRLNCSHMLLIDRRTGLPKKWRLTGFPCDRVLVYTRFDLNPPKRELKVSRPGFHEVPSIVQTGPGKNNRAEADPEPFRTLQFVACCFRVMTWCPF